MARRTFDDVAILLRTGDSVAVLKRPLKPGDELLNGSSQLPITQNIGAGHKIALVEIPEGGPVRKYGQIFSN